MPNMKSIFTSSKSNGQVREKGQGHSLKVTTNETSLSIERAILQIGNPNPK